MTLETTKSSNGPLGSALVVGGGIAGIQASLDLAESGFYVYLIDQSPAIGGTMPQLDKTFPTNDCSMCILSPKLVECGRHLNIEVITCADLLDLQGGPGRFKASIRRRPRYVDQAKCTGCGECAEACPVQVSNEFDRGLSTRKAIYRPYAQAFPNVFTIEKRERPPCAQACPAGVNPQGYAALISKGKYREATALIRETLPLPRTLGRICPHPCEDKCNRALLDEPVSIAALKRFVADGAGEEPLPAPAVDAKPERVAIVGSGPAGLTAAYHLARAGYRSTIFEALPVPGGMLAVGIPSYRLPKEVLQAEIRAIERLGVEIRTNTRIGEDLTVDDLLQQGYSAVFIAIGAHRSRRLYIPGERAAGVIHGVTFLRELNLGNAPQVGRRVAVIGGGDVAVDAARSTLRLGAEQVTIYYRRSALEMPARKDEVEAARQEGVRIEYLVAPVEVVTKEGRSLGMRCTRMELGAPDAFGRREPFPVPGSEFFAEVDTIIPAIGQVPDLSCLPGDLASTRQGTIGVNRITLLTSRRGVFAGGDCVTGPALAIDAVAAGKEAAISIMRYLAGEALGLGRSLRREQIATQPPDLSGREPQPRAVSPTLPLEARTLGFREVDLGLSEEAALKEANRCFQCGVCAECFQCVTACKAGCIDHHMKEDIREIEVGAVVLAPGFEPFDPRLVPAYSYGTNPDVLTSLEFERILSASGPFQGHLVRPSDGSTPRKIAWIQCVGSRDAKHGAEYCSAVCCMYALKQAVIAKEHSSEPLDTAIFYMDMRTHGKEFERYLELARDKHNVRLVRARIHNALEPSDNGGVTLRYATEDGTVTAEHFDLAILSVGLRPPAAALKLAQNTGIALDQHGFCQLSNHSQVTTSRAGIFAAGAFAGPKDIPETVAQASAAASEVAQLLAPARGTLVRQKEYPPEQATAGQRPRIGVFVCHCGINIGGIVDVPAVRDYAASLPNVVMAEDNLYTCSQDTQERIKRAIREHHLNRVVVASCSPRTHEAIFRDTIREAGLNPHLFEMANIRDQCSWVHMHEAEDATRKACDLVRMAVAKVRLAEPLKRMSVPVTPAALVIGGGVAGMTASLALADQGFSVELVEAAGQLGGMARRIHIGANGANVQAWLRELVEKVTSHPLTQVHLSTEVVESAGFVGNFRSLLRGPRGEKEVLHGAAILAIGSQELKPAGYFYGHSERVLTLIELEEALARGDRAVTGADTVVLIQCVGSRNDEHAYCSRVCCTQSVRIALALKSLRPEVAIYILYRDLRTYGLSEVEYQQARQAGIIFLRYEPDEPPVVSLNGHSLQVEVIDRLLQERLLVDADLVGLAAAAVPADGSVARLFKTPLNQDGFLLEAHAKLRPVDSATEGVFLCGAGLGPKSLPETVVQAAAAAARAGALLSKRELEVPGTVAAVNSKRCSGCGTCELVCPYGAIAVQTTDNQAVAVVNEALCKGCGVCVASCRSGAVDVNGWSDRQILAAVAAL